MADYKIVRGTHEVQIEAEVLKLMAQGWKPQGGVSMDARYFYQAMVRVAPKINPPKGRFL